MESDKQPDSIQKALKTARGMLARRGHAEHELRLKLEKRDFSPEVIDEATAQLRRDGALDDKRFAEHQADVLQKQGWGPRRIRQKLRDRGISDTDIEDALQTLVKDEPQLWLRRCVERMRKQFGEPDENWSKNKKAKIFRHLKHRGFNQSLIRGILFDGVRPDSDQT